ncbi:hypothetical protein [Kiritimatiella glycovorans]|uniref:Copper resistance protein B n=1 Tax=Kiritimatiella glycovorans TaxID=1307763 RepID=A0A0G3EGZ1_9BACT|nr:hypothetical protein [Kiritimatiella glycovorans]AKJ63399.1 hypothetical protein L21SP4_00113 [Kiritimatiella glycovorans]
MTLGAWYAQGTRDAYDELNLYAEYGVAWKGFEFYAGYTRLEFIIDDAFDHEFGAGVASPSWGPWTLGVDYVYSTEADGAFVEAGLEGAFPLLEERVVLVPALVEGVDFGYASPEYDGPNHLEARLTAIVPVSDDVELSAYLAHSWGQGDVDRDGGKDLTWGGMGAAWTF